MDSSLTLLNIDKCRFCNHGSLEGELLTPCGCKGKYKFSHEKCLKEHMKERLLKNNIPGFLYFYDIYKCENCIQDFQLITRVEEIDKIHLCKYMTLCLFNMMIIMFLIYNLFGYIMTKWSRTHHLFFDLGDTYIDMFINGFIMIQLNLTICYAGLYVKHMLIMGLYKGLPCTLEGGSLEEALFVCLITTIFSIIIFTFLNIYIDYGYFFYYRYKYARTEIIEIRNFESTNI